MAFPTTATIISDMNTSFCTHAVKFVEQILLFLYHIFLPTVFARDKDGRLINRIFYNQENWEHYIYTESHSEN